MVKPKWEPPRNTSQTGYGFESLCKYDNAPRYSDRARFDFCMLRREVCDKLGGRIDDPPDDMIERLARNCASIRKVDALAMQSGEPEYGMMRFVPKE